MSRPTPLEIDQAAQEIRRRYEACKGQLDGGGLPVGMSPQHRADVAWLLLVIDDQREVLKSSNAEIVMGRKLRSAATRLLTYWDDCSPPADLTAYLAEPLTQLRDTAIASRSGK